MAARRRRVKDAAPYGVASFAIHRTTGERPDQARPKRVTRVALWFNRTVATGGRAAMRQRSPRTGTFPPSPRTKLPRKRGPGGRLPLSGGDGRRPEGVGWATKSTIRCSPEPSPGDLFAPFGSLQKGLAAGAAKSLQIKRRGTNPAGGASPRPTAFTPHRDGASKMPRPTGIP